MYGAAMYIVSNETTLLYTSTIDCPGTDHSRSVGAQFDINSLNVTSKCINITGGQAIYCSGIEYRYATSGFFRFQSMSNGYGTYITAFSDIEIDSFSIDYLNYVANKIWEKVTITCLEWSWLVEKIYVLITCTSLIIQKTFLKLNWFRELRFKFRLITFKFICLIAFQIVVLIGSLMKISFTKKTLLLRWKTSRNTKFFW